MAEIDCSIEVKCGKWVRYVRIHQGDSPHFEWQTELDQPSSTANTMHSVSENVDEIFAGGSRLLRDARSTLRP